jgi:hypothetical protein
MLHLLLARAEAGAEASEVEGFGLTAFTAPPGMPTLSPGIRVNDLLRPIVVGAPVFFNSPVAGTWSSWGRG